MKLLITCLVLLLLVGLLSFHVSSIPALSGDVAVLSHHGFLDSSGYYHIFGEVKNNGLQPLRFVEVVASYYNSSSAFVTTSYGFTEVDVLFPGRKGPFHIILSVKNLSAQVDHYTLDTPTYLTSTKAKPPGLKILSRNSFSDTFGYLHIAGQLENGGASSTTYAEIIATFYNQTGTVLGYGYTFSNPSDLSPGQVGPFELIFLYDEVVPNIATYDLTCQSWDYSDVDPQVELNLSASFGGTTNPSPDIYNVTLGQTAEATAVPDAGYGLVTWELNEYNRSSQTHILVVMTGNATLRAYFRDNAAPTIGLPSQIPTSPIEPGTAVEITVQVADLQSGIKTVKISYRTNTSQTWNDINMTMNSTLGLYQCVIPQQPANTLTSYKIIAEDNAGNQKTLDNNGQYYTYATIPEFSPGLLLVFFAAISITITFALRKRVRALSSLSPP